ncbi:MAG TPA: ABC transporter substrate-binding protein [Burkholderiales bacterium]|jgi:branched-chain amino acid transport system substrate-binding protein|nr:ABC transporter substrate-binding protein [Burkholderiales bacterium]
MDGNFSRHLKTAAAVITGVALTIVCVTGNAQDKPIRIGLVTFLSGPAAGPFGVPARIAAEAIVDSLNAGKAPAPYSTKGFGGTPLELTIVDEAGGATKQVTELRNLVERQNVDFVIGYISSGDCLAVAPVAEELKTLTVLFDCGTPRVFEEASYKYVFRTRSHATMDAVAGAMYLLENRPAVKSFAGINQNYAWGQDSWSDFSAVMATLKPEATITSSQMPKFGAGQYGPEISALLQTNSDVIHSSLWGGDLEAFMLQATPRNLFARSQLVLVAGEPYLHRLSGNMPDGTIVGARGPNGVFAQKSALNDWLRQIYKERAEIYPNYPAYSVAMAFLGLKAAYEKARGSGGSAPATDEVIKTFEFLNFDSPAGKVMMKLGKGHQAVTGTAYGTTRTVNGQVTVGNVKYYPLERVQPPEGVKSLDWIKSGMKPGNW